MKEKLTRRDFFRSVIVLGAGIATDQILRNLGVGGSSSPVKAQGVEYKIFLPFVAKSPENIISKGPLTIENNSSIIKVVFNPDFSQQEIQEFLDSLKVGGNQTIVFRLVSPEQVPKYGPPGTGCYSFGPSGYCNFAEYPESGKVIWIMGPHGNWGEMEAQYRDFIPTARLLTVSFTHNFEEFKNAGAPIPELSPLMHKYWFSGRVPLKVIVP